jgi:uncharacterized membrane protein YoaK (UPF0700 family)
MFVSEAHSVTQQSRLAITLAWIAGYTNAVTLLTCHTVTSHASGTTSNFGIELASQQWALAGFSFFLLFTFVLGAILSGLLTECGRRQRWESIYVLPMGLQGLLLAGFALCIEFVALPDLSQGAYLLLATGLASSAMGLQNATITRISSGVVRTTHVTGVLTDLGLESAHYLLHKIDLFQGKSPNPLGGPVPTGERLLLLLSIVGSFAFGAALGTAGFEAFPRFAMFPPVLFLGWIIIQDLLKPIAEISVDSSSGQASALENCTVFRLTPDRTRRGRHQRLPNLAAWAALLSPSVKAIILDLSEIASLHETSLQELEKLSERLKAQGRSLLVAGYRPLLDAREETPPFFPNVESAASASAPLRK